MKNPIRLLCALPLLALALPAQPADAAPPSPPDSAHGHRPPPPPLLVALDANHDGVISADEIARASTALLTLDKNHDGQLTPDEFRPAHAPHGDRPPRPEMDDSAPPIPPAP